MIPYPDYNYTRKWEVFEREVSSGEDERATCNMPLATCYPKAYV